MGFKWISIKNTLLEKYLIKSTRKGHSEGQSTEMSRPRKYHQQVLRLSNLNSDAPGTYTLVDHSIFRVAKGAIGQLVAEGVANPAFFRAGK